MGVMFRSGSTPVMVHTKAFQVVFPRWSQPGPSDMLTFRYFLPIHPAAYLCTCMQARYNFVLQRHRNAVLLAIYRLCNAGLFVLTLSR